MIPPNYSKNIELIWPISIGNCELNMLCICLKARKVNPKKRCLHSLFNHKWNFINIWNNSYYIWACYIYSQVGNWREISSPKSKYLISHYWHEPINQSLFLSHFFFFFATLVQLVISYNKYMLTSPSPICEVRVYTHHKKYFCCWTQQICDFSGKQKKKQKKLYKILRKGGSILAQVKPEYVIDSSSLNARLVAFRLVVYIQTLNLQSGNSRCWNLTNQSLILFPITFPATWNTLCCTINWTHTLMCYKLIIM